MNNHTPSRSNYTRGCRCAGCTEANRQYSQATKHRRSNTDTHTPSHGRYAEGCRCKGCTQANRDYMRWYRKNRHLIKRTARESQLAPGKLSIRPLLAAIEHVDDNITAERIGVGRGQIQRWKREGLNLRSADRVACKLGFHPYTIWGNDYWHAK